MKLQDMILISVDDHAVEPPNMFDGRLAQKYVDRGPKVLDLGGSFGWVFGSSQAPSLTTSATAGAPKEEKFSEPKSYADVRAGTYDVHERVKDMSINGVLAGLNFPSFPRFAGQLFAEVARDDADLALAVLRAYNDWHIEEWCGSYPDRFIPCMLPALWDGETCAAEIRRNAERGCHAMTFSMNPYRLGLPSLFSDEWEPVWAACDETETVVCMHVGSDSNGMITSPDAPYLSTIGTIGIMLANAASDLVWAPMLRKYQNLKFALSEGGIGWVPYFLERIDYTYKHHVSWRPEHQYYGKLPSEIFKERIITCFIDDEFGMANIDRFNVDMVTWECDYPHPDSTWPMSPESAWETLSKHDDETINKISHLNAMKQFSFDPFGTRSRAASTVGALRLEAAGQDTTFVPGRQVKLADVSQGQMSKI